MKNLSFHKTFSKVQQRSVKIEIYQNFHLIWDWDWLKNYKNVKIKSNIINGTPCSKQARNIKFKWLNLDSNLQPFSSSTNTQPFSQIGKMIELCCDYFSVWSVWLYVLVMSRTRFRVDTHFIACWMNIQSNALYST